MVLVPPRSRKGRTVPAPWCRRHEHLALSVEVLGEDGREALMRAIVDDVEPDWETGCWKWTGKSHGGYGRHKSRATGEWVAHRLTWHAFHEGHALNEELDHRHQGDYGAGALCVSPFHLQPVTKARNIELRDLRREAPDRYWHLPGDAALVPETLLSFAYLNSLPLKTPEMDDSAYWEPSTSTRPPSASSEDEVQGKPWGWDQPPVRLDTSMLSTEEPASVSEGSGKPWGWDDEPPASVDTGPALPQEVELTGLAISEKTLRDLKLSPLEAARLQDRSGGRRSRKFRRFYNP